MKSLDRKLKVKNLKGNDLEEIMTGDPSCWKDAGLKPIIALLLSMAKIR